MTSWCSQARWCWAYRVLGVEGPSSAETENQGSGMSLTNYNGDGSPG